MEQLIIDTLEQYFTSGEYQYCEPNILPTEYRTILAGLKKLEQIEQIIKRTEGTLGLDNYTVQQIKEVLNG